MGDMSSARARDLKHIKLLLAAVVAIMVVIALRAMYFVAVPLVFSLFLAGLVRPIQVRLEARLPRRLRPLAVATAMLAFVLVLAVASGVVWLTIYLIQDSYERHQEEIQSSLQDALEWVSQYGLTIDEDMLSSAFQSASGAVGSVLTSVYGGLGMLALLFFFVLLLLLEMDQWRSTITNLSDGDDVSPLFGAVASKARKYFMIQTFVGLISGVAEGLWLWTVGVELALLWALLFFLFNYVPTVGPVIAAIPPVALALATHGLGWAVLTAAGVIAIEQTIGGFIDPRLQGKALKISPFVVLASVVFWGWLWGIVGAILAVPLTVTAIIAFAHWPSLRPVALFLGRTTNADELPGSPAEEGG